MNIVIDIVIILLLVIIFFALVYIMRNKVVSLNRLAYKDRLIQIGNATFFYEKCLIPEKEKRMNDFVYVVIDLDDFKMINKIHGYDTGDKVLQHIAKVLKSSIGKEEIAARIDADIFSMLLKNTGDNKQLDSRLKEIIKKIKDIEVQNQNQGINIKPSMGVYIIERPDEDIVSVCTNAYLAREVVKGNVEETLAYYDNVATKKIIDKKKLLIEFADSLENREFKIFYQLKHDLKENKPVGAEALIRWYHKEKGLIMPIEFINLLEANGDIESLDLYVFEGVCKDLNKWVKQYGTSVENLCISVNISRRTLFREDTLEILDEILKNYNVKPENIEIEITETFFLESANCVISKIEQLREMGFKIAVDDFGSGYSALNILREINADVLKIDKAFLDKGIEDVKTQKILHAIIGLGKDLGLQIVAEGVENKEQSDYLKENGCDIAQGFYYSKPIDSKMFEEQIVNRYFKES